MVPALTLIAPAAKAALKGTSVTNAIITEKFGYDFLGLAVKLGMFFAVAYLVQIYVASKVKLETWIRNPATIPSDLASSGFFGLGGIVINYIWSQFKPDDNNIPTITPPTSEFYNNNYVKELFSDEGFHGLHFWDLIKMIAVMLVIMEWNQYRQMQKATGGKVNALTHGVFLLIVIGLGLTIIPDLLKKLKSLNFNREVMA